MLGQIKHGCGCGGGSTYDAQTGLPSSDEGYTWNGPQDPKPEKPAPKPTK